MKEHKDGLRKYLLRSADGLQYVMLYSKLATLAVAENDDLSGASSHTVPCNYTFCKSKRELKLRLKIVGLMEAVHGA